MLLATVTPSSPDFFSFVAICYQYAPGMSYRLLALCRPLSTVDGIEPTCLYGTNKQVDELNIMRLEALDADSVRHGARVESAGYCM